jgi:DNA-binding NtrC family response regulator
MARSLTERGIRIAYAESVLQATAVLRSQPAITLALCDASHDIAALNVQLDRGGLRVAIIACADQAHPGLGSRLAQSGARDVVTLPCEINDLLDLIRLGDASRHDIIAQDPLTTALLQQATRLAASEASILILGESGTGKEMFARHIHRHSRRAAGAFVAVNCAALPENLLESELFGYEKGAFSGAAARRIGKFEAAHRGTLLLDEIGEIDIKLQAKLLRAIQEREIDRIGGDRPIKVDVRILATTNRDLLAEVRQGRFREDLYYRLNVVSLELPPLRKRPGDILPLAEFFAKKFADLNGLPDRAVDQAFREDLRTRPWHGNVRELENVIHRSVLTSSGSLLGVDPATAVARATTEPCDPEIRERGGASMSRQVPVFVGNRLDEVERFLILETLEHTSGNRTHAAMMLGISIRALRNKIREYTTTGQPVRPPHSSAAA